MATQTATPVRAGRGIALAVILTSQLMMVLDTSIITTALPKVQHTFHLSTTGLTWVQSGYALAFGGLLLLGARAGDLFGRRTVFLAGVALFTLASLATGLAPNTPWLLTARAVQGLAAAAAIPSTLALILANYPKPAERARAIALYSAVIGAGGALGNIIGGLFTEYLSWRWGLLINVPIGAAVLLVTPRVLPSTPRHGGRFDLGGALTSTLGMTALVFGLTELEALPAIAVASLVASAVLLLAFVLIERRAASPIVPLSLFRSVERSGAYAGRILIVGAMFSLFYFLSQYLQNVLGFTPLATGAAFIPLTGLFFAMVHVVPALTRLMGRPALLVASLVVALLGMLWLSRLDTPSRFWPDVVGPLLLLGIGQGIAIILLTGFGMSEVPATIAGAASGLVNAAHQLGGTIGLAILTIVFSSAVGPTGRLTAHAFGTVFGVSTVFYALAVLLAIAMLAAHRVRARRAAALELDRLRQLPGSRTGGRVAA
jgi:EmrB/QacA subfamily drug resistance transporter